MSAVSSSAQHFLDPFGPCICFTSKVKNLSCHSCSLKATVNVLALLYTFLLLLQRCAED